ncbi:MAG: hypothetical protein LBL13_05095 [Bacteroidales bacterium]|jgi:hypothetical protein|nr:hypothetical protein [Bacteroidales bacterium]
MDDRISFSLDETGKQRILAALQVLNEDLLPSLIEPAQGEARELPTMGDKSYGFVFKALCRWDISRFFNCLKTKNEHKAHGS